MNVNFIDQCESASIEIEKTILGACIRFPEYIPAVLDDLKAKDFFGLRRREIFLGIKSLYEKGHPIEPLSLSMELKAR
jgi:replicative DNA helicase